MIRSLYCTDKGQLAELQPKELATALADIHGLVWVDLTDESPESCQSLLLETFGFHPLAVDDALVESHIPKIDDWGSYLYLVLHAIVFDEQNEGIGTVELDLFLGDRYVVSYHEQPIAAVDRVWNLCQRDRRHLQKGADHLLYRLADELVASYMPVIERMDELIDRIEDQLFDHPAATTIERLFALKRALLHLRRILAPQREVFNKLARDDYGVIDIADRIFFRDVYDHLVRLHDISESLRDLVSGALDTYLSVINNRMNEIMKTLTLITTLFMPLSFVTGFFGMNFFQPTIPLDAWTGQITFALVLVGMLLIPLGMYLWMRKRAWA
ncbi:MAG: magnesium/cobalt transporter CorA [Anaerolineae bacterium]